MNFTVCLAFYAYQKYSITLLLNLHEKKKNIYIYMSVSVYRHSHLAVKAMLTIDLKYHKIPKHLDTRKIVPLTLA